MTLQKEITKYKEAIDRAPKAPKSAKCGKGYYVSIGADEGFYYITKQDDGWLLEKKNSRSSGFTFNTKKQALQSIS